jgi:uncharacterized damage-inducible protein DinB
MRETLLMYARDAERADKAVAGLFEGLSLEARNADRGAHYGGLHGLFGHVLGGTLYFHSLFRASYPGALAASERIAGLSEPEGAAANLDSAGWERLKAGIAQADAASVELVKALGDEGLSRPVKLDWYGGNPESVPFHFLFNQMIVHGIHHRGQISQILDEMKVEHDFSGIDLSFMPR